MNVSDLSVEDRHSDQLINELMSLSATPVDPNQPVLSCQQRMLLENFRGEVVIAGSALEV